ncbi:hypothetical protein [Brucella sp. LJL56]
MKSWGERLVARLKNWRSHKSDAAPDQTPGAGRGEPSVEEPIEDSIKVTPIDFDEKPSRANQQVDPANAYADAQMTEDGGEPKALETASSRLEEAGREAIKPSTSTSGFKSPPKQPGAKTPESGGQRTTGKDLTAQEGATADETSDREGLVSSGTNRPDQELKKQVTSKALTKRAGGKATVRTGPKNPSEEVVTVPEAQVFQEPSAGQLSQGEKSTNENAATPVVPASPQKRPRLRKPETADEQVTDDELAELEAENIRLKLLLRKKLSAKQDNSRN